MRERDLEDKQAVQAAVRQVASEYLSDPNISSVGIGYKTEQGRVTDVLALQFTVGHKFGPEEVESAETRRIPPSIKANGLRFVTDVLERSFQPDPVTDDITPTPERSRRIDPIVPGVSIAHEARSAGTLGCVVKETVSGTLRLLSNWHVLHGATGQIGDAVVQPGPSDDDRTENVCGYLTRSHLGLAGDCAISSISGRAVNPEILGLGVAVRRIGDPELGDRVTKSGRTTGVTHGIVTRLHTITALAYGGTDTHQIGGFEIGPDASRPAAYAEISTGGDSGSAWLAVGPDGQAQDLMVGLHFAGERGAAPEYAMACYASSVFDKLGVEPLADADLPVVDAPPATSAGPDRG